MLILQVGSVFDLGYLASLHGIASLRGEVDQEQEALRIPRRGKQNAVDRKIKVKEEDESEAEDGKALPRKLLSYLRLHSFFLAWESSEFDALCTH